MVHAMTVVRMNADPVVLVVRPCQLTLSQNLQTGLTTMQTIQRKRIVKSTMTRQAAVASVIAQRPAKAVAKNCATTVRNEFGINVFGDAEMRKRLPSAIYATLTRTIKQGAKLDAEVAEAVAQSMKDWAIEKGATHYAHVFQPLTGLTAEKHDSFLNPDGDGGTELAFTSKQLIQGEPDASSFPSGGIRATFEARGYTTWDTTSPAYILENPNGTILCIPTAFCSWTGEALDKKTPVLRSMQALNQQAQRVLRLFGHTDNDYVFPTAGPEQEYFLVDRQFFCARPDLFVCGRSLFGARPAKGQEFEDQYFGIIPERILCFMLDVEQELYKLGVPIKTRHNEVAPGQFEIAPVYENANVAADHQHLVMITLKRVAEKHGLACLLHEKPFAGINGSGKHLNWSLGTSKMNLLEPGRTPHENAQFLIFCAAIIRAVHENAELLRVAIAHAGNDHRLGANEAPPAIISIFLGDMLTDIFRQIENGGATSSKSRSTINVGVDVLPPIPKDAGDRNRTSPFAFTGNKFEFRAVGANQSISGPLVILNTIVAESLDYIATRLEQEIHHGGQDLNSAVQVLLHDVIREHKAIIFNGDGYSECWHQEAARRKLPNHRNTVDALAAVIGNQRYSDLLEKYGVLSNREFAARNEIYTERYCKDINTEALLCRDIAKSQILPAAYRYQGELAQTAAALTQIGRKVDTTSLDAMELLVGEMETTIATLERALTHHPKGSTLDHARHYRDKVLPAMHAVREVADRLERIVADDLWPLPTYQEMLFLR